MRPVKAPAPSSRASSQIGALATSARVHVESPAPARPTRTPAPARCTRTPARGRRAGQDLVETGVPISGTDASGNAKLEDIGPALKDLTEKYLARQGTDVTLEYLDPSYHIRSVPASPTDSLDCWPLARNAVHAAMAGNTEMLMGRWHGRFVHVPMPLATRLRKQVNTQGDLWTAVVEATGRPLAWGMVDS